LKGPLTPLAAIHLAPLAPPLPGILYIFRKLVKIEFNFLIFEIHVNNYNSWIPHLNPNPTPPLHCSLRLPLATATPCEGAPSLSPVLHRRPTSLRARWPPRVSPTPEPRTFLWKMLVQPFWKIWIQHFLCRNVGVTFSKNVRSFLKKSCNIIEKIL
jgi:hypothetical protein